MTTETNQTETTQNTEPKPPMIYKAMADIMREIEAVDKGSKNKDQNYSFRGIDAVYNMIHSVLAKHGVYTKPRVLRRIQGERATKSGSTMIHVVLEVEYVFVAEDGSRETIGPVWAEALDTSDKSTNKAMAFAQKYALLQTFTIPTEDVRETTQEREGDATTPEAGQRVGATPASTTAKADPIGREMAARIYTAFGAAGVTKEMLNRKIGCADVADVSKARIEEIRSWNDAITNDKRAVTKIFGGSSPAARAEHSQHT